MSKRKYPVEIRLAVVIRYLPTDKGYRFTSACFNILRTQVRMWIVDFIMLIYSSLIVRMLF